MLKWEKQRVEVGKQCKEVLLLVKKNANIHSLLTNNNIMLADYADVMICPKTKKLPEKQELVLPGIKQKETLC